MLPDERFRQELLTTFQAELAEHLGTLNRGLLALEQEPAAEAHRQILADLFRAAHSLKGSARVVGLTAIETTAHRLEDALGVIRQAQQTLTADQCDVMLAAADVMREAMTAHLQGQTLAPERLNRLYAQLEAVRQPDAPAPTPLSAATPQASPASPPIEPPPLPVAAEETIRVATAKLDALMDSLGELLVVRMRTEQMLERLQAVRQRVGRWQKGWRKARPSYLRLRGQRPADAEPNLRTLLDFGARNEEDLRALGAELAALQSRLLNDRNNLQLVTDDLQNRIRHARMLPIATLFEFFPRMVRDLARTHSKDVLLQVEGAEVEVDRQTLELLKDPLTHLLRNALDHGVEPPAQREAAGKARTGRIRLAAEQRGNYLLVQVADDGRGIDLDQVRQTAVAQGMLADAAAAALTEAETLQLIFRSGISTAPRVTELSGRGVGMDVVRQNVEQLHGNLRVETHAGAGTTFTLTLPLTLTTSQILFVRAASETLGVPMVSVERILRLGLDQVGSLEGRPAIYAEGHPVPLIHLAQVLQLPEADRPLAPDAKLPIVIVSLMEKRVALRVDSLLTTQEVVVKPLGRQLRRVRNVAGATLLGDGQLVVILNLADLLKSIQSAPPAALAMPRAAQTVRRRRLLVVDDSITTRTLEKHILENAGYQVWVTADGQEAWELIRGHADDLPDLVVSDINMPRLDGFELTKALKGEARYAQIPLVLVTSLDSPQDRIRGLEAGADAYLVKSAFDQRELLETIERLIG